MSVVGDAFTALKNVMLLHERIEGVRSDVERLTTDLKGLTEYVVSVDKRLVRIETMIEMAGRAGGGQPRIEG